MEVRNQRTAQSLLASCSPLLRSRSFGATTLPPRPMRNCWKARTGRCWRREREETTILFSFFQAGFFFLGNRGERRRESRRRHAMHTLLSIDSPGRSDKHFYLSILWKPVQMSHVSPLPAYSLLNQSAEEAYRFYVLAFNSHAKKNIFYIHQLDLQVNVL